MNNDLEAQVRRTLQRFEHDITETNRRHFEANVGSVQHADFLRVAEVIAELRAQYIKAVLKVSAEAPLAEQAGWAKTLHAYRLAYEESLAGFNELRHALERGYFTIQE